MYYKVKDATSAVANVDDYSGSAQLLAATTLRNVLGTRNLGDILSEREAIAQEMQSGLDEVENEHRHRVYVIDSLKWANDSHTPDPEVRFSDYIRIAGCARSQNSLKLYLQFSL